MNFFAAKQMKLVYVIIAVGIVMFVSYQLSTSRALEYGRFMIPDHYRTKKGPITQDVANFLLENDRWMEWVKVVSQRPKTPAQKRLPDIIGIGEKKCGTGAMMRFLAQHPLVETADTVETMFFSYPDRYQRGLEYYKELLPQAYSHQLIAEKSPGYFQIPGVLDKIKAHVPNAKFILSLCDPTNRAFSDFVHIHEKRLTNKENTSVIADLFHQNVVMFLESFSNSTKSIDKRANIAEEACRKGRSYCIFSRGIYFPHLSKWQNTFNESQLLVLNGERWMTNPGELLEDELDFLKLPKLITRDDFVKNPQNGLFCINRWWHELFHRRLKTVGETEYRFENGTILFCLGPRKGRTRNGGLLSMRDDTRILLRDFFRPYNQRLYKMLGHTFNW